MAEVQRHHLIAEADNALKFADALVSRRALGVGVYATEASHFAPAAERKEDTTIVVLRGEASRRGRKAITELADLIRSSGARL